MMLQALCTALALSCPVFTPGIGMGRRAFRVFSAVNRKGVAENNWNYKATSTLLPNLVVYNNF